MGMKSSAVNSIGRVADPIKQTSQERHWMANTGHILRYSKAPVEGCCHKMTLLSRELHTQAIQILGSQGKETR